MRALKTRTAVAGCWKSTMTKWEQSAQLILLQLHAAAAKSLQSCPTLCNPTDGSPPGRLPRPWDSPDKNTGLGCHFLLQCMKVKSESEVTQSCPTLNNPMDCSLPGSSAHGIFQARVLEWVVIAFSVQLHETLPKNSARWPFYCHWHWSKLERWKNSITEHLMSWLQIKKPAVIFSYSTQQQWTISPSNCDVWQKVDFIWQLAVTGSVAGLRRNFKALP